MKRFLSIQTCAAVALVLLGATVASGWILHIAVMVQIEHNYVATVFAAALCFLLLGIAQLLPILNLRSAARAQATIGWGLIAIALTVLIEHLSDQHLAIDFPFLHSWLKDGNPRPGQMAPDSVIGFMLSGLSLVLMQRVNAKAVGMAIIAATFALLFLGLTCLGSYFLHLDLLYVWFPTVHMGVLTGVGMIVSGIGLWSQWRDATWYRSHQYFKKDEKIGFVVAVTLMLIAVTAGVAGFATQQATLERTLSENLMSNLKHQATLFHAIVRQSVAQTDYAAANPALVRLMSLTERLSDEEKQTTELDIIGQSMLAKGLSGIALYDTLGHEVLRQGRFARTPQIEVDLGMADAASLRWDGELYLRSRANVVANGHVAGVLEVEQSLPLITEQFAKSEGIGATGEMGICVRQLERLLCFPERRNPTVYTIPIISARGTMTPMGYAVAGRLGIFKGLDYRGHQVIAAYGPLSTTGLGIAIKQDTEELYQPIREQLQWYLPLLLLLIAGGAMALRGQVKPLVSKLLKSEHDATETGLRLRAVIDNIAEGIITTDEHGVIESFNPAASKIFGHSETEAVGMTIKALLPSEMHEWFENSMQDYLRDGETHIVGKGSVELPGLHKDGAVITLELAINELCASGRRLLVGIVRDISARKQSERALQESEARFREITQTLGEGVLLLDHAGTILFSNPAAQRMLGWTEQDFLGRHGHTLFHHSHADGTPYPARLCEIGNTVRSGQNFRKFDEVFWCKDGSMLPVSINSTPIRRDGQVVGEVLAFHDIVERKKAQQALAAESTKNAMLLRTASDGIHVLDPEGNVVLVNDAFCRMLGYTIEEMQGMNVARWDSQWSAMELNDKLSQLSSADILFETRYRRCDGTAFDVEIHAAGVVIDGKKLLYASARDISERKRAAERMDHLAHFDLLTDLPNRVLLSDRLRQALAKAKRDHAHLALMFIDLDKFKPVNDTLGHDVGDLLLKEVAKRLQNCLRESDTVARMGGDEFVVLLPLVAQEANALLVAQKILAALTEPFALAGHKLHISASIGVAIYPEHGKGEEQLLKSADYAMYQAKERGGAAVFLSANGVLTTDENR